MPLDWQARRTVELHMTFEQLNQLTIPDPGEGHAIRDRVVEIAGRLAAGDERYAEWAAEVGVPVGSVRDEATKQDLICELDACVAHLHGLDDGDLAVVYETFHESADDLPGAYCGRSLRMASSSASRARRADSACSARASASRARPSASRARPSASTRARF